MSSGVLANIIGPDGAIALIVVIVLLFVGGSRVPKLARGLGAASHEFRRGMEEGARPEDEERSDKA